MSEERLTTLAFPDALTALSNLIPNRVRLLMEKTGWGMIQVLWRDHWRMVQEVVPPGAEWDLPWEYDFTLELVLREECEARGWAISMDIRPGTQPNRHCVVIYTPTFQSAHGDTPAHAFSLAMIAALNGQK